MEVGIRVEAEDITNGTSRRTNSCYFTMVAVDEDSQPAEVPPLAVETETERRRNRAAALRRRLRREFAEELERASDPDAP
jgi:acyl-CoA hydrolase